MKTDKLTIVRNWILDLLESGEVPGGGKLPVTRDISAATGISLLIVQSAVESLSNEGALFKVPRHGVYVHPDWRDRVLQRNFFLFDPLYELPYLKELKSRLRQNFPQVRVVRGFERGIFEVRPTGYLQAHHDEYADLSEIFRSVFPDTADFLSAPFEACRLNGRLVGLPLIFSPRVIYYNPRFLKEAGIAEPEEAWSWSRFSEAVTALHPILPPEKRFLWKGEPYFWLNHLLRAGGQLIDSAATDPVQIDSPATRQALNQFRHFLRTNGIPYTGSGRSFSQLFLSGEVPFLMGARQVVSLFGLKNFRDWKTVSLPHFTGGVDTTLQATDIFCVRRECADRHIALELIKLLFGKEFQNYLADIRYGIPVRSSAIKRSLDLTSPTDRLFLQEIPKMTSSYNLYNSTLFKLVAAGIDQIISGEGDVETETAELANMTRTFLKLCPPENVIRQNSFPHTAII